MPGEGGPVGGGIASARPGTPATLETTIAHNLVDGDLVRISTASGPKERYVKAAQGNTFSLYMDAGMTQPADVNGVVAGDVVERLNVEDWAIITGINYYPAFTNLKGPVNDATEFERWTLRRGFVPRDHVISIQSPPDPPKTRADAEPTINQLSEAFQRLVDAAEPKRAHRLGRRLYLFFSGHGIVATLAATPDYREAALLMANAGANSLTRHIGARAHAEWFRALGIFDEVIMVADCCRDVEDNVAPAIPDLPKWRAQRPAGKALLRLPDHAGFQGF